MATVNGTAALHVALLVAGVRPGDLVLTSAVSFIAPANAIRYAGADPLFVDVDPATWEMDPILAVDYLNTACERRDGMLVDKESGRRIGAVLPVHILGHPVDLDPILAAAAEHGVPVVEDATESLGARYRGRPVGSLGDIACFSFNGNKLVTCGGGGMIVTAREDWAARARHLTTQARTDAIEYDHDQVGFNYRLTNLQAAVGCAQMENLGERVAAKRRIADRYRRLCDETPGLFFMPEAPWAESAQWLATIRVDAETFGVERRELFRRLADASIQSRPLWRPLFDVPAHKGARVLGGNEAMALWQEGLSLPCSCDLSPEDQERVCSAIIAG